MRAQRSYDRGFTDRRTAGRILATKLADEELPSPVVLGLARGGVPVAYEVARTLQAPLRVLVARKVGAPGQPEFGVGAVTAEGPAVLDDRSLSALGLTPEDLRATSERERMEARRRAVLYGRGREPISTEGRDVVVCDDGLATGVTARAALRQVRPERPRTLVFAAPVCAPDAAELLLADADQVDCLARPEYFRAVGTFYLDFHQVTDEEVLALLDAAERDVAKSARPGQ